MKRFISERQACMRWFLLLPLCWHRRECALQFWLELWWKISWTECSMWGRLRSAHTVLIRSLEGNRPFEISILWNGDVKPDLKEGAWAAWYIQLAVNMVRWWIVGRVNKSMEGTFFICIVISQELRWGTGGDCTHGQKISSEFVFDIIMPLDYCISNVTWHEVPIFICIHCFCRMVRATVIFLFGWISFTRVCGDSKNSFTPLPWSGLLLITWQYCNFLQLQDLNTFKFTEKYWDYDFSYQEHPTNVPEHGSYCGSFIVQSFIHQEFRHVFFFSCSSSFPILENSLEVPTSSFQVCLVSSKNIFSHMIELLYWKSSNFSLNIGFQILKGK
jgi:hypothetical protein